MANGSKSSSPSFAFPTAKRGRERGQNGWLEVVGKTRKKWKGHFCVYELQSDGSELRRHRALILGFRSEMTRKQAEDALRQIIIRRSEAKPVEQPSQMTFGQFWRERFLPLYEQKWKVSSRQTQIDNVERYCVRVARERSVAGDRTIRAADVGKSARRVLLTQRGFKVRCLDAGSPRRSCRSRFYCQESGEEVSNAGDQAGEQAVPHT